MHPTCIASVSFKAVLLCGRVVPVEKMAENVDSWKKNRVVKIILFGLIFVTLLTTGVVELSIELGKTDACETVAFGSMTAKLCDDTIDVSLHSKPNTSVEAKRTI